MKKAFIFTLLICSLTISVIGCDLLPNNNSNNNNNDSKNNSTSTATTSATSTAGDALPTIENASSTVDNDDKDVLNSEEASTTTISNSAISKDNVIANRNVRLFYYDVESGQTKYTDKTISINDGALVSAIINSLKKQNDNSYGNLDPNIDVRSAKLDKDKDLLTVNFGENFVNTMNLGSGPESSILQAVVNSLGYNYDVSKVYITVDGKPYSSGHIVKEVNEPFEVNYENTVPIK